MNFRYFIFFLQISQKILIIPINVIDEKCLRIVFIYDSIHKINEIQYYASWPDYIMVNLVEIKHTILYFDYLENGFICTTQS